jgi:hypothetical protein
MTGQRLNWHCVADHEGRSAHKKGGVDLSAFHATQGRRIFTLNIRYILDFVSNPDETYE